MDSKNYKVIIEKTPQTTPDIALKLAGLFKLPLEKAQAILSKDEFVIKKQTDKSTAEKFHKAITSAGALCRIEEISEEEEETALPTIEEMTKPKDLRELTDPTRTNITPLQDEKINLSLASRPDNGPIEKSTSEKTPDKAIEDINPENFCPDCGTIRASADSICIHCGYDPEDLKTATSKLKIIYLTVGILILATAIFLGMPYYQQYTKRVQIESDLTLAFDTRNTVTEFIQTTNFWPNQNIDAGLPELIENRSIESVVIGENAVIMVTLRDEVVGSDSQTLIFTPNILKGRIVWNCLKGTLVKELRPEICLEKTGE